MSKDSYDVEREGKNRSTGLLKWELETTDSSEVDLLDVARTINLALERMGAPTRASVCVETAEGDKKEKTQRKNEHE